ncbi:MAG: sulfatase [Phycisphaerae bacterium]|jgi:arylsulfatase A-like enzyme|nr:sulfatase [Phycisphaerae bacterium]MDP7287450.1 sulfatase [Phycisphaerae bacterium]
MKQTIDRRGFVKRIGLGAAALAIPNCLRAADAPAGDKPNIVFILADDLGWSDVGCYGHPFHETPNIDRLAAGGMRFTDAYAACSVCSPTRASIMTGKYPATLGLTDWIPGLRNSARFKLLMPDFIKRLPLEEITIAEMLKAAGYVTGAVGKWHLGPKGFWPENQGFDVNIGGNHTGTPAGGYFLPNRMTLKNMKKGDYLTDRLSIEGAKFIEANKDRPFFLYQSYHSVHTPIQAKKAYVEKYKGKKSPDGGRYHPTYAGMIQSLDEGVGRILDQLDKLKLTRNTLVFFMSDNGGLNSVTAVLPLRAGKGHIYEGGIREPMIVRYPKAIKAGATCAEPVSSVDFLPTIMDIAGVKLSHKIDGLSFASLLKGQKKTLGRKAIYWHHPHYSPQGGRPASAIRCGAYKLIKLYEGDKIELYNLKDDISEKTDLVEKEPKRTAEMKKMLDAWLKEVKAKFPKPNPNYKQRTGKKKRAAKEQPATKVKKGSEDGDFDVLTSAGVDKSELGYAVRTGDMGVALKKLDKPLGAQAVFKVKLKSLMKGSSLGIYRNGFLAFGDGVDDASLIKCGLYLGGQRKYVIAEGALGARQVIKPMTGDPLGEFSLTVTADLKRQTVTMICGEQKLTLKLSGKLKSVTHAGYSGMRTTTAFSKLNITGK